MRALRHPTAPMLTRTRPLTHGKSCGRVVVLAIALLACTLPLAAQTVSLSPASLTFGTTLVGTASAAQNVILKNTGSAALRITSIAATGDFAQTNNCRNRVKPGNRCTISVTFRPNAGGTRQGSLTISDNAPGSPQQVSLAGTGTVVSLSPTSLSFPAITVGTTSPPSVVTLTNVGTTPLNIGSIAIGGVNAADFAQTNTCPISVAARASCTISVTFAPTAAGTRSGELSITDDGGGSPQTVMLTGSARALVSVTLSPANPSIPLGTNQQFKATGTFSDGTTQDLTSSATWASSDVSVATVSNSAGSQGLATSVTQGTSTITATSGSVSGSTMLSVAPAALVSLTVTPTHASIALGIKQQFAATGTFTDGSTHDLTTSVTWSSANTAVAVVSNSLGSKGLATSTGMGTTTVTATSGSVSGATDLTVTPAELLSIAVTPAIPSIPLGTRQQFAATGNFTDGSTKDLTTSVTWSSSATTVATISNALGSQGLATGGGLGTATIAATLNSISDSTTLTVTPAELVSLAIIPANPSLALGSTQQFTATGTYTDGSTQNLTTSVTWSSSQPTVATINTTGLATSKGTGTTTITAASGDVSGSTTLTVAAALVSLAVTPATASIALGTTQQFTATGTFSDGSTQDLTASVHWSSSVATVATISDSSPTMGLATSVGTGSTTITAASGSITGSATLTVTPAALVSLALAPLNPSIPLGSSQPFTATGTFTDGSTQDLTTTVTWSSANTAVAVISNTAGSQGLATSASVGTTTITATSGSVSRSTSLNVTSAALVSLTVTPANPSIALGTKQQFTATGTFTDGSTQDLTTSVTWSSSQTTVATISTTGLATSKAMGTTTITAASSGVSGSTTLTVTAATLVSLVVTPANATIVQGTTQQFAGTGTFTDGSTQDLTTSVIWSSSTPTVATISNTAGSQGLATSVGAGTTTITAKSGSVSQSTLLSVTIPQDQVLVGAGDIMRCNYLAPGKSTASLLDGIAGTVFADGDLVYPGTSDWATCYDPYWGRHKARTLPIMGNHEYDQAPTSYFNYWGAAAGDPSKGYYSLDLGAWHVVVINSQCSQVGGCQAGSPQEQWLRADLAAHPALCTIAFWHIPLFPFSVTQQTGELKMKPIWQALYDAGADVVVSGHHHEYGRFAPQQADGTLDPIRGVREFLVGTGGNLLGTLPSPMNPNIEVASDATFGVLKLTLHATSYDWQFIPVAGGTFTDSGSAACH